MVSTPIKRPWIFLFMFLLPVLAWAQNEENIEDKIEEGVEESYEVRPDIRTVPAQALAKSDPIWTNARRGLVETLAMILEMYRDHEIYFLARDGEALYDLARLLAKDDPTIMFSRIHLINVSRANVKDPHLPEYLYQEGISKQDLSTGLNILLVDTGRNGSIPLAVHRIFPEHSGQIKTQLLSSNNPLFPSSRVFLAALDPSFEGGNGSIQAHLKVLEFEKIHHYTQRSFRYAKIGSRWHPVSYLPFGAPERKKYRPTSKELRQIAATSDDRIASRPLSLAYMADLKFYYENSSVQALLARRRKIWNTIRNLVDAKEEGKEKLQIFLRELQYESDQEERRFNKALVMDFFELYRKNFTIPSQWTSEPCSEEKFQ